MALRKAGHANASPVYHTVTGFCRIALCATEPGTRSGWAEPPASHVTCPACLNRLSRLQQTTPRAATLRREVSALGRECSPIDLIANGFGGRTLPRRHLATWSHVPTPEARGRTVTGSPGGRPGNECPATSRLDALAEGTEIPATGVPHEPQPARVVSWQVGAPGAGAGVPCDPARVWEAAAPSLAPTAAWQAGERLARLSLGHCSAALPPVRYASRSAPDNRCGTD